MCRYSVLLVACLSASPVLAEVRTQLSSQYILADETVTLTLEIDRKTTEAPDLEPLRKNFSVLSRQRTLVSKHSNGLADYSTRWAILLAPRSSGSLQIPPLQLLDEESSARQLQVTGEVSNDYSDQYLMRVSLDKNEVYQNSQIIYTMQLFHRKPLSENARFSDPVLKNGLVEPLTEQRTYEIERQGEIYSVVEQSYAVFPQETGPGLIRGPVLRETHNGKTIEVPATDRMIEVLPGAFSTASGSWLPAEQLTLKDQLTPLKQGFERTLTLSATGLPADLLPVIMPPRLNGAEIELLDVELSQTSTPKGLVSTRTEHLHITPLNGDPLELPAIDVAWWNTRSDQGENSFIPARKLDSLAVSADTTQPAQSIVRTDVQPAEDDRGHALVNWLAAFSLFSALGWLTTAAQLWRLRRRLGKESPNTPAKTAATKKRPQTKQVPPAHEAHDSRVEHAQHDQFRTLAERNVFESLQKVCEQNNAEQSYRYLLEWSQIFWPDQGIGSVRDIGNAANSKTLHFLILDLESHLTQPHEDTWQGDLLLEALKTLRQRHQVTVAELYNSPASDVVEEEVDSAALFGNSPQRF